VRVEVLLETQVVETLPPLITILAGLEDMLVAETAATVGRLRAAGLHKIRQQQRPVEEARADPRATIFKRQQRLMVRSEYHTEVWLLLAQVN